MTVTTTRILFDSVPTQCMGNSLPNHHSTGTPDHPTARNKDVIMLIQTQVRVPHNKTKSYNTSITYTRERTKWAQMRNLGRNLIQYFDFKTYTRAMHA